jgi:replicative DNA helicase
MAGTSGRKRSGAMKIVEVPQVDQYGHKQPQSLDMEVAVLGALMVEQDSYGQVAELLKPESFYDHRHQLIYQAIQTLNAEQKPVDIMTVI